MMIRSVTRLLVMAALVMASPASAKSDKLEVEPDFLFDEVDGPLSEVTEGTNAKVTASLFARSADVLMPFEKPDAGILVNNGTAAISVMKDGTAHLWTKRASIPVAETKIPGEERPRRMVRSTVGGAERVAVMFRRGGYAVLDAASLTVLHQGQVAGIKRVEALWVVDDDHIMAQHSDDLWVVWNVKTNTQVAQLDPGESIKAWTFDAASKTLFLGTGNDGHVRVFDVPSFTEATPLVGGSRGIHSLAVSPDGSLLAAGTNDEEVFVWDWKAGEKRLGFKGKSSWKKIYLIDFSPDGSKVIVGTSGAGWLHSIDIASATLEHSIDPPTSFESLHRAGSFVAASVEKQTNKYVWANNLSTQIEITGLSGEIFDIQQTGPKSLGLLAPSGYGLYVLDIALR